ncbi:MAG TPA: hypothetical protein VGB37_00205, partial [Candidatus Lokiarchaeia archaeon]
MLFVEFPLNGDLRLPLIVMEWIFIITTFEISFVFLIRFFNREKSLRNFQDVGYFAIFFGFSLMWLFYIVGDYYVSSKTESPFLIWKSGSYRALILNFGYFTMIIAGFVFFLCTEKYNVILIRRYLFTSIFAICSVMFVILFLIDIRLTQPITYIFWMGFLTFFLSYLVKFSRKLKERGFILIIGLALMLTGFLLTTDAMINVFGLEGRFFGAILQLISVGVLFYFFNILPPFNEFDWKDKLEAIFLIDNSGLCLYNKIIKQRKDLIDENLISAAISSINFVLNELTGQKERGISVFKKKGENVIIYPGKYVSGVVYTTEELYYPKVILKEFVDKFEMIYENILINWDGEVSIFKPTEI